jgi:hypothetical protein
MCCKCTVLRIQVSLVGLYAASAFGASGRAYHAERPKDAVVYQQPGLLAEPRQGLSLGDALEPGEWRQNVFHDAGAQAGEEDNAEGDEVCVIGANAISSRLFVVVGEVNELAGVYPGLGDEAVSQEEEGDEVKGETCLAQAVVSIIALGKSAVLYLGVAAC